MIALTAAKTYDKIFINANPNPEYILFYTAAKDNALENRHYPPTISKDQGGGTVPSQQLIDAFTMKDGSDYIITSQLRDKDTDEVIKEIPSEKALEMLAKAWELAGIIVDERR